ncbi:hypothetical protein [Leptothrix discophora]|uniref:Tail assembly chaperone n=1 Tax=Leptothrix discophora TaxID=89 RepID=A0ABT9G0B7_LEPDI|nr:hypothetical protein [Leptothrix discophora]MDP4299930.1 hypothetical protein [Leptothrix discophora]
MTKPSFKEILRPKRAEVKIMHPVYGETEAIVYLVGGFSKQFRDARDRLIKELGPDVDITKADRPTQIKFFAELYASCVIGWNEVLTDAHAEFSYDAALQLFTDAEIEWIGGQLSTFINDSANFFRPEPSVVGQVGSTPNE